MSRKAPAAEKALAALQRALRSGGHPPADLIAMSGAIPEDLALPAKSTLFLDIDERRSLDAAVAAVAADERFEYLDRKTKDKVWRFACQAALDAKPDFVPAFIGEYAIQPKALTCFFPIEALSVSKPYALPNSGLLPLDDPKVPAEGFGFDLGPPVGSVLAVPARGTHFKKMAERAGAIADHDLRVLRMSLRAHRSIHDQQLRFRRAIGYSFGDRLSGWRRRPDTPGELGLNDELYALAASSRLATIAFEPRNDLERKAALALRWIERGFLEVAPLESLLFFFFALEALLGDKAEGLKARGLAFRRAMLSAAIDGTFSDPDRVYLLYDRVRSAAVHGGIAPDVDERVARRFGWDVRDALIEYLQFAQSKGITKRSRLLRALDSHPDRPTLVSSLREFGDPIWDDFPEELPT